MLSENELMEYEIGSLTKIRSVVIYRLFKKYFMWKIRRKYKRYMYFKERQKLL